MNCKIYNDALAYLDRLGYEVLERNWRFEEKVTETRELYKLEKKFCLELKDSLSQTQKIFVDKCAIDPRDPDITILMMNIFTKKNDSDGKRYLLFFCQEKDSVSNDDMRRFFSIVNNMKFYGGLFVHHGTMKKQAHKIYSQVPKQKGYMYIFKSCDLLKQLLINNNWSPKVVRVEEKGKEFLEKCGITILDCPKIHVDDFSAVSSNASPGSVLVLENRVFLPGVMIRKTLSYAFVV